ncbi:DarT ssDNA thymidine ADP-ribosyltransferase family protein [Humidesulfovibrio sp.]|uniref:DarT ssDNA thymidine ADP-ribosyltransferase family protein n=1 Tax=Humidesulfovibrio sp. TaxID=2910988 RepID=UPI0035BE1B72
MLQLIRDRCIQRVVHFTTNIGLVGILNTGLVKSRKGLNEDQYLCHILHNNCECRKDEKWTDYISLSVQVANKMFLSYAKKWDHNKPFWWCILSFCPSILTHEGVVFCTTNNSYEETVLRGTGKDGLQSLYADVVKEKPPYQKSRTDKTQISCPTSPQAEVLYPKSLELKHLTEIIIPSQQQEPEIMGYLAGARQTGLKYTIDADAFE